MTEHEIEIVMNGTKMKLTKARYTYEQLYQIAFPGQLPPQGSDKPITYSGSHGHEEGSLRPGESIQIRNGMVFNVVPTHKS